MDQSGSKKLFIAQAISYHKIPRILNIIFDHQRKEILYREQRNYLLQWESDDKIDIKLAYCLTNN